MASDPWDVKAKLRAAFVDFEGKMTDGEDLTDRFIERLNTLCAASEPFLTWRQEMILIMYYSPLRRNCEQIAQALHVSERTVVREKMRAERIVARRISDENLVSILK